MKAYTNLEQSKKLAETPPIESSTKRLSEPTKEIKWYDWEWEINEHYSE